MSLCSNCKWWAKEPIITEPPTNERLCLKSKRTSFGAYGQDGKALITWGDFGCNAWETDPCSAKTSANETQS